jgi:uncharacterized protein YcfL
MKGILLLTSLFLVSCSSTNQVLQSRMDNLRTKMNSRRKPQSVKLKSETKSSKELLGNARAFGNYGSITR